jgi:phosphoglycolate phosphatase-like HAD superfamily hydrolase
MATGSFFAALGYKFYVKAGTTASTVPTTSTGMTEVLSLSNAGIQGSSDTTDVLDYGSTQGFKAALVTGQSYTIPCTMNLDLRDAGYKILKDAALNATTKTVEWFRESPEMSSAGAPETHAGVAFVTDFSEDIQAGNIAQVSFTLTGYGAYTWAAETDTP